VGLILSFLSVVAAIAVLIRSNKQPVTEWKVTPPVILAILSVIFNSTLAFALSQGARISWWYVPATRPMSQRGCCVLTSCIYRHRALKGGTVADLSRQWTYGTSVKASLLSGRYFNPTALATIIVTAVVINGPLLQRASTIITQNVSGEAPLKVALAQLLPPHYMTALGTAGHDGEVTASVITQNFTKVISDYQKNIPITTGITDCAGNCSAIVQAAGIVVNCEAPVRTLFIVNPKNQTDAPMFSVNTEWTPICTEFPGQICYGGIDPNVVSEIIQLTVGYVQPIKDSCNGTFVSTTCNITEAVVEYSVDISGKTVTLDKTSPRLNVVALADNQAAGTLTGLQLMAQTLFGSNVTWQFEIGSEPTWTLVDLGVFPSQYLSGNAADPGSCLGNLTWVDPTDDILTAFNEIMFRSALQAGVHDTTTYNLESPNGGGNKTFSSAATVNSTQTVSRNQFLTHFGYVAAAVIVMVVGILAVMPTFYGWWRLGRDVSLNPIETAKAFDAPILGCATSLSNAGVDVLVKNVGSRRIVYEENQVDGKGESKLMMRPLGA
jgi:hypothetical protein